MSRFALFAFGIIGASAWSVAASAHGPGSDSSGGRAHDTHHRDDRGDCGSAPYHYRFVSLGNVEGEGGYFFDFAALENDRTVHGNTVEKKELDPANRGSLLLGSVAFFLDRYGYDVLPLAMALATRQPVPPRIVTQHQLVTPANAFVIYPPIDMN